METTPSLIQKLGAHAQRYGADDAAVALIKSIKQTYLKNKPGEDGYDGLTLQESFERIVTILATGQVAQAAAHNALKKAYDTVFGPQQVTELVEQAQWTRLIEVLDTEMMQELRRQRILSEFLSGQIGSNEVLMLFGINAVIDRTVRLISHRKERTIELILVHLPAGEATSSQILSELKQILPADVAISPIRFTDVAEALAKKVDRVLLAPVGLSPDLQLVVPRGSELLVSLAEQTQTPVMVPLAPLDLYQYPVKVSAAHQAVEPSPIIQYVLATGIFTATEVVAALGQ
ncbi:MAG: hypothetical protein KDI79_31490 [Anaerolineae bacterium]|nr:hypothetical protein [Anaerolineae bacterium]